MEASRQDQAEVTNVASLYETCCFTCCCVGVALACHCRVVVLGSLRRHSAVSLDTVFVPYQNAFLGQGCVAVFLAVLSSSGHLENLMFVRINHSSISLNTMASHKFVSFLFTGTFLLHSPRRERRAKWKRHALKQKYIAW